MFTKYIENMNIEIKEKTIFRIPQKKGKYIVGYFYYQLIEGKICESDYFEDIWVCTSDNNDKKYSIRKLKFVKQNRTVIASDTFEIDKQYHTIDIFDLEPVGKDQIYITKEHSVILIHKDDILSINETRLIKNVKTGKIYTAKYYKDNFVSA